MTPQCEQPDFANEDAAKAAVEKLLQPWFFLKKEVQLTYPETTNHLRIDYLGKPKPRIGFPYALFGIECKKTNLRGGLNRAIKQAVDYTQCKISDERASLANLKNQRVEYVFIFPGPTRKYLNAELQYSDGWNAGVERLASLFRVGIIYVRHTGRPQFNLSGDRKWDPDQGPTAVTTHVRQLVGNGTLRRNFPSEAESEEATL